MKLSAKPIKFEKKFLADIKLGAAWEVLADTNAMNKALGFPRVKYDEPEAKNGVFIRKSFARLGLLKVKWLEYPFEWIKDTQYSVMRDFVGGPISRFWGGVRVEESPQFPDKTIVTPFFYIVPKNIFFIPLANLIGKFAMISSKRYMTKALKKSQSFLPIPTRAQVTAVTSYIKFRQVVKQIQQSALVNPTHLQLLVSHLRQSPDEDVLQMQPYRLAELWGQPRKEILQLFLYGTIGGLLDLDWVLICPNCRIPKADFNSLRNMTESFHCDFCNIDYAADLEKNTELRFSIRQDIRPASSALFCIGNPANFPHVLGQTIIGPNAGRSIKLKVPQDGIRLRLVRKSATILLETKPDTIETIETARINFKDDNFSASTKMIESSHVNIELMNSSSETIVCIFEDPAAEKYAVTALDVSLFQEFRRNFSSEVLAPGKKISVQNLCIMFTDIKSSTKTYEEIGDAPAFARVRKHFDFLEAIVTQNHGSIVKTIGDAVMARFPSMSEGLAAAFQIQEHIAEFNRINAYEPPIIIKAGLHQGAAIAINANNIMDFFGRTINFAVRLTAESVGNDVVIAKEQMENDDIKHFLIANPHKRDVKSAKLKGFACNADLVHLIAEKKPVQTSL